MGPDRLAQPNVEDGTLRERQHRPTLSCTPNRATPVRLNGANTPLQETRFLPNVSSEGRETPNRIWT